jgi:cytochrome b561
MTKTLEPAEVPAQKSISGNGRFDRISIALHVLLITGQLATAWLREAVGHESGLAMELVATHQANGLLIWIVGLLRLVWRRNFAYLPPFPQGMAKLQQTIRKDQ